MVRYPQDGQPGEARVERRLDPERPVEMATEAAIARFGLPLEFSAEALREAQQWGRTVDPAEASRRVDLRALPLVTIDGEDAKDFDDAVYAERLEDGGFRLRGRDRRREPLRARRQRARSRGARARHLGLFSYARAADAANGALESSVLARAAGRSPVHGGRYARQRTRRARGEPLLSGGDALGGASHLYPGARGAVPRHSRRHARASATLSRCAAPLVEVYRALAAARRRRGALDFDAPETEFVIEEEHDARGASSRRAMKRIA